MSDLVKQITVAWEDECSKFDDMLVLSKAVNKYRTDATTMERGNDTIWRPMPYISTSFSGRDQTANFNGMTQLAVPARQGYEQSAPWAMTSPELRDSLQEQRLFKAAIQKIASDINLSVNAVAANQGTIAIKRSSSATGFDDVGLSEATMNELGVMPMDRIFGFGPRDFLSAASNLQGRQTVNGIVQTAYEKSLVQQIAGFDILKLDYTPRLLAASGTSVTINGANQYYTPVATALTSSGEKYPVDNRYQTVALTVGGGSVRAGDSFTITGVNSVHHITKADTGQLKTFRIISQSSGTAGSSGNYVISPPIISSQGGTTAEEQYQNVTATPADTAPLVFLNTVTANVNPFFHRTAIELLPGRVALEEGTGLKIMRATTESGIELVMSMYTDINTYNTKFRVDAKWGVVMLNPEMSGIMQFSQT